MSQNGFQFDVGEAFKHLPKAQIIESVIQGDLADLWGGCSQPGWDGYNALPVTWDSYSYTEQLLRALPFGMALPALGAEPDGQITLEWGRDRRRRLSVSVSPTGELHYAALLGAGKTCGMEPFFGEVPAVILTLIRQVT